MTEGGHASLHPPPSLHWEDPLVLLNGLHAQSCRDDLQSRGSANAASLAQHILLTALTFWLWIEISMLSRQFH